MPKYTAEVTLTLEAEDEEQAEKALIVLENAIVTFPTGQVLKVREVCIHETYLDED